MEIDLVGCFAFAGEARSDIADLALDLLPRRVVEIRPLQERRQDLDVALFVISRLDQQRSSPPTCPIRQLRIPRPQESPSPPAYPAQPSPWAFIRTITVPWATGDHCE